MVVRRRSQVVKAGVCKTPIRQFDSARRLQILCKLPAMKPITKDDYDLLVDSLQNDRLVFLDGFHSVKHALRFNAQVELISCAYPSKLNDLILGYAPDLETLFFEKSKVIRPNLADALRKTRSHWTGVYGVALRPEYKLKDVLKAPGHIVLLENPYNYGNLGACIRIAAATRAAGVLLINGASPWEPAAIRGAAGLQFAVPVVSTTLDELNGLERQIIALDPEGLSLSEYNFIDNSIFAFGTEREGLSNALMDLATVTLGLPMREGVSSINLAATVGIVLYTAAMRRG